VPLVLVVEPPPGDPEGGIGGVRGALVPGAAEVSAAWVAVRAWTLSVRDVLAELGAARLRWCLSCGRVGLWGWRPLTPSMPITFVCADRSGCRQRQAVQQARTWRGGGGFWREGGRGRPVGDPGRPRHPRLGLARPGLFVPRDPATAGPSPPPSRPEGDSR
jgi:hypothetical protein